MLFALIFVSIVLIDLSLFYIHISTCAYYSQFFFQILKLKVLKLWIIHILNMLQSKLSVIRQKGESQNVCFKKTKHIKFSEKRTFLVCVSGGYKCTFFGKFDVLCFLDAPVLRFAPLP